MSSNTHSRLAEHAQAIALGTSEHRNIVRVALAVAATLAALAAPRLQAQEEGAVGAYFALIATPVAALPELPPDGTSRRGIEVHALYGHTTPDPSFSYNSIGVGLKIPVGAASLGLTVGYLAVSCDNDLVPVDLVCDGNAGHAMIGSSISATLFRSGVFGPSSSDASARKGSAHGSHGSQGTTVGTVTIGLEGAAGLTKLGDDEQAYAARVSIPVALNIGTNSLVVTPFLSPGIGVGHVGNFITFDDGTSVGAGGMRGMLGGGIGFTSKHSGFGASIGFGRVFIEGGATQFGMGVSWRGVGSGR